MPARMEARRRESGAEQRRRWLLLGALALMSGSALAQGEPAPAAPLEQQESGDTASPENAPEQNDDEASPESSEEDTPPVEEGVGAPDDFMSMDADLLLFQDMPVVVSAGRRAQRINQTSAPVSLLDADDIHYSGLSRIEDILPFLPGVDVHQIDRNRFGIGVRGLSEQFTSRTLFLLDGRIAENPILGAVEFDRLPIFMEDIERIEVVRGPSGAAWGANAANGVINVITKKPGTAPESLLLSQWVNQYGDTTSFARWDDARGDLAWRASFEFSRHISSEDAIDDDDFDSSDWRRSYRFDTQAVYALSNEADLSFGVGGSHNEDGGAELLGDPPPGETQTSLHRAFVKLDHDTDWGSYFVQWYGTHWSTDVPGREDTTVVENVLATQFDFDLDAHQLSLGGDVRVNYFRLKPRTPSDIDFGENVAHEQWVGFFVSDRWQATKQLAIEGQARVDWYSETGADWSGRLSALWAIDAKQRHVIRLSAAKAFRAPLRLPRELDFERLEIAPGVFVFDVNPAQDLDNEQIWSIEAGYSGILADHLSLRANAYYQRYSDLIGFRSVATDIGGGALIFDLQPDNIDGADAWGAEVELVREFARGRASIWYAYNDFSADQTDQSTRAFHPTEHKVGASARIVIIDGLTASANYRWSNPTLLESDFFISTSSSHRLDLTLAAELFDGRGEAMIGVMDVLDDTDDPVAGITSLTPHETPGRTFFFRVQLRF